KDLPIILPEIDQYLPTEDGKPPLGRAKEWFWDEQSKKTVAVEQNQKPPSGVWGLELNTMPGWAGSSWYFLRYMDPTNDNEFVAKEKVDYWQNVDLYIGGAEHATGHLLYARFWTKFLHDLGHIPFDEPFKKMINQGMIQGNSALVYRLICNVGPRTFYLFIPKEYSELFSEVSKKIQIYSIGDYKVIDELIDKWSKELGFNFEWTGDFSTLHVDINLLDGNKLDIEKFRNWREEYKNAIFILEDGSIDKPNSSPSGRSGGAFVVGREVEKMSKSKYNVQTPDELVEKFGADTLRCYEMFLGPLEQHKPWDTQGITGVHGFLKKLWRLFHTGENESFYVDETPILASADGSPHPSGELEGALKSLHKTIKKVKEDIERFSFNTPVSAFMICVNELTALKCNKREILEPLLIILAPYAPHIAEELWAKLGNTESITYAVFPKHNEAYLVESNHKYPISFNGKMRFMLELPADMSKEAIEKEVLANEQSQKYLE